jgi:hypothetical protein
MLLEAPYACISDGETTYFANRAWLSVVNGNEA